MSPNGAEARKCLVRVQSGGQNCPGQTTRHSERRKRSKQVKQRQEFVLDIGASRIARLQLAASAKLLRPFATQQVYSARDEKVGNIDKHRGRQKFHEEIASKGLQS